MPIFFLHIRDGTERIEDREGYEFASLHAACDEAIHAAREMLSHSVKLGQVVDERRIEVADAMGATLATIPLRGQVRLRSGEGGAQGTDSRPR